MAGEHSDNHDPRATLPIAALLRAAADGEELSGADRARLESHLRDHPEDEARIEYERRLRSACSRVMSSAEVPPHLRSRIEQVLANRVDEEQLLDRLEAIAGQTRRPGFWSRIPASVRAAAAAIILVLGAVALFYAPGSPLAPRTSIGEPGLRSRVVSFLHSEHERCNLDPSYLADKLTTTALKDVPETFGGVLGTDVSLGALFTSELEFVAGGPCAVPGGGRSMHLAFRLPETAETETTDVSLFIQENTGTLPLEPGTTYRLTRDSWLGKAECSIYAWVRDGLVYYLVSTDEHACGVGRRALQAPERVQQL